MHLTDSFARQVRLAKEQGRQGVEHGGAAVEVRGEPPASVAIQERVQADLQVA
jgi:hypothetical protein